MSVFDSSFSPPQVININSKDRIGGSNSSFLSKPIDLGINKYNSVCMVQSSIPKSWYNIPDGYNTFTLRELGSDATITIPPGTYNKNNLMLVLPALLNAGSISLGHTWTYTISYPNIATGGDTFKYTWTVSGNSGQPSFVFDDTSQLFRTLGFEPSSTNIFSSGTLTSANCLNFAYILRLFIQSNICTDANDGILQEILNVGTTPFLSTIFFDQYNLDLGTKNYNRDFTQSWNFSIVDSYNKLVDLNGVPWSFTLYLYERSNTHELHKNDLIISNEQRMFDIQNTQASLKDQVFHPINPEPLPEPYNNPEIFGSSNALKASLQPTIKSTIPQIHYPE